MNLQKRIDKLAGKQEQIEKNLLQKKEAIKKGTKRQIDIENLQALLQVTAKETQGIFKVRLEDIVQTALDSCFPGKYTFCIDFIIKRGSTVCDIYLLNKYGSPFHPTESNGGGVVDIISLALRIATWALTKPAPVLVLDEPFKWLSAGLRPLAAEFLRTFSTRLGIQIIMNTHDPLLVEIADKVFKVILTKSGKSKVRVIREE